MYTSYISTCISLTVSESLVQHELIHGHAKKCNNALQGECSTKLSENEERQRH